MNTLFHSLTLMTLLLLTSLLALAQNTERQRESLLKVTMIVQSGQVRFVAQEAVQEMRLQIFNQTGELVFDTGAQTEAELAWPLQDAQGNELGSGLYAYTLSTKNAGVETTRTTRGHFIVDRARDREATNDRLWITSQSGNDIGTAVSEASLTIARSRDGAIAGTDITPRALSNRSVQPVQKSSKKIIDLERDAIDATSSGTPGQIARWVTNQILGDSVMTELTGNIGIGTAFPDAKLTVNGDIKSTGAVQAGSVRVGSISGGSLAVGSSMNVASGIFNTFVGFAAGRDTTGDANNFFGNSAGLSNSSGSNNNFFGYFAGGNNSTGSDNNFKGFRAGQDNTTGNFNTFIGSQAGLRNTTGSDNTFVGRLAGDLNQTGSSLTLIGSGSDVSASTPALTNATAIGAGAIVGQSNSLVLGNTAIKVGIGTSFPRTKLDVNGGNAYFSTAGNGIILKAPNGTTCRLLTISNTGALTTTGIACP